MTDERTRWETDFPNPGDAEETIYAIRRGAVDAFVVEEPEGHRIYALEGADLPYAAFVERMQQGAAMLTPDGEFLYCNPSMEALLVTPKTAVIGKSLQTFLEPQDWEACRKLLKQAQSAPTENQVRLRRPDGSLLPASFSFLALSRDKSAIGLLVTDLTAQKDREDFALRLQQVQDEERRAIARELHDSVGQLLVAISMNLGTILRENYKIGPEATRATEDSTTLVDTIGKEIRTISYLLHPPLLELAGLASALRWYIDGFSERSKIQVELDIPPDLPRLASGVDIALFRIVQECLTNVHRHSGSRWCSVTLTYDAEQLRVEVKDSGHGIPPEKRLRPGAAGLGLRGMRERLRQLGGTLELRSDDSGTTVEAVLPMPQAAADSSESKSA